MKLRLLVLSIISLIALQVNAKGKPGHKPSTTNCTANIFASLTTMEPGDSTNLVVTVDSSSSSSISSFTVLWLPSASVTNPDSANTYAHPTTTTTYTVVTNSSVCGQVVDSVTITMGCTFFAGLTTSSYYCAGSAGTASINPFDGVAPYTYAWSNGQTTASVSGLAVGSYSVLVKDSNGCSSSQSFNIFKSAEKILPTANPNTIEIGDSTNLFVSLLDSASNSSASNSFTVSWSPTTNVTYHDSASTYAHPTTTTTYTVTVTTACKTYIDTVTVYIGCTTTAFVTNTEYFCNAYKGMAIGNASGGIAPYTYAWSNGKTTDTITGLNPGKYVLTVEDFQGCMYKDSITVLSDQVAPGIQATPTSISPGDSVNLYAYLSDSLLGSLFTGPYTLKWTPSASVTSPDSAFTYAHPKTTTTYTVSAVTPCGTVSDTVTITVIVAGINTISSPLNNMSVSPNPANGLFAVNYNLLKDENIEMSVIDEFGRIVFEKQLKGQHAGVSKQVIDLTNLPQGIYSLRMIADEGISVKKVVIVKN